MPESGYDQNEADMKWNMTNIRQIDVYLKQLYEMHETSSAYD